MAALDLASLRRLPPSTLYVGAGVLAGGGYLLYRRRRGQAATPATSAAAPTSLLPASESGQQSSIVPYYLTGNQDPTGGTLPGQWQRPPKTTPTSIPGATGAAPTTLPDIPPLLPVSPPTPSAPVTPTAPSPAPPPAPPPSQQVSNLPGDILAKIRANGEQLIGNLIDPLTGGTWWFGDKGGVFGAAGARFLGSVPSAGAYYPGFKAIQAIPIGTGYRIVNSGGQTYNFGG